MTLTSKNIVMNHYSYIASMFVYPEKGCKENIAEVRQILESSYPETLSVFKDFFEHFQNNTVSALEEYYLNTFEIKAVCCMDVGYVLFGEDYKRGDFLAKIQHEQIESNNNIGIELADHLPNILTLLPKLKDTNLAFELSYGLLIPAVKEMFKKFEAKENIYKKAFEVLLMIFEKDFQGLSMEQYQIQNNNTSCNLEEYACGSDFLNKKNIKL